MTGGRQRVRWNYVVERSDDGCEVRLGIFAIQPRPKWLEAEGKRRNFRVDDGGTGIQFDDELMLFILRYVHCGADENAAAAQEFSFNGREFGDVEAEHRPALLLPIPVRLTLHEQ